MKLIRTKTTKNIKVEQPVALPAAEAVTHCRITHCRITHCR